MGEVLHIEDALNEKGVYVSTTSGVSMYPMLRNRRDTIIVKPPTAPLKKYDVPLYRRGDDYVLHRIIGKDERGYIICGDNCINKEYGITENQIIGVLVGFYRDGNEVNMEGVGYKLYSRAWVFLHPLICAFKKIKMKAGKVKRLWHSK